MNLNESPAKISRERASKTRPKLVATDSFQTQAFCGSQKKLSLSSLETFARFTHF
jgi:hypothetical protein